MPVTVTCSVPHPDQLGSLVGVLGRWQADPWPGHLHPGDLGWHSSVGAEQTARDLRVWKRDDLPIALGVRDGAEVLRMALDPELQSDQAVADRLVADLNDTGSGLFPVDGAVVEARGASALGTALRAQGWVDDEPWTPMTMNLRVEIDLSRLVRSGLRIAEVGPEAAGDWTSVHWSSFRGTPFDDEVRDRFVHRWTQMTTGPFSGLAHSLVAYDSADVPVAITTVWTAGAGRPGLIEPMGVHRAHHGQGWAVAVTLAGARRLQELGCSSAAVVAENSNPAALATYGSAGFTAHEPVTDLRRG